MNSDLESVGFKQKVVKQDPLVVSAKINQILGQGGSKVRIPSSHFLSLDDIPELIQKLMIDYHSATKTI